MSVSRPARCLFSVPTKPTIRPSIRSQNFHTSLSLYERRRPTKAPIKKAQKGSAQSNFKPYTAEEKAALSERYTPEQIRAIELGENAIDPNDLQTRGVIRTDLGALSYLDDFSKTRPMVDWEPKYEGPEDPTARLMDEDEMVKAWMNIHKEMEAQAPPPPPKKKDQDPVEYQKSLFPTRLDVMKMEDRVPKFIGHDGKPIPRTKTPSTFAPGLPRKFEDDENARGGKKAVGDDEPDPRDPDGRYNALMKETGMTLDDIFELKIKIIHSNNVTNQTRLGKIVSLYCIAVAGNGQGRLGLGEAKGQEAEDTQSNARIAAIRAMQPIPRYEERTIYGEVEAKVSASVVKLMSRPPGMFFA